MTQLSDIKEASHHDRELSGDTCCQSVSSQYPDDSTSRGIPNQGRSGSQERKDAVTSYQANKQLDTSVHNHPRLTLLDALHQETEDLLRTPLTAMSSKTVSEHGFPLGVEVARTAYDRGLLSTGAFYRDCLPPALSVPRTPSSVERIAEIRDNGTGAYQPSRCNLSPSPGRRQAELRESKPVVKRRNISHDAQIKRIDQAPLSAIYEEPAGSQHACTCGLCSESESGRGIVWFHLCPRYAATARENRVTYEPCEGRIIMHHGPDRSSVGLIIEGPMEERFVPAANRSFPSLEVTEPDTVKSPKPGKLDVRAMHSATGHPAKSIPRSTSGPKIQQLPPISTPALQRPISPATQVSHPTSLNPLYSVRCPKEENNDCARDTNQTFRAILEQLPAAPSTNPQDNIHPAFRTEATLPVDLSGSPSEQQSHSSTPYENVQCFQTPDPEDLRRTSNYSNSSGERPARSDSLGALSYRRPCEEGRSSIDELPKTGRAPTHGRARHMALSSSTASILSPFASHERTPSVFLSPSTPSTASFLRSSTSSYGDPLLPQIHELEGATTPADTKERALASPFQPRRHSISHAADADPFSPQDLYYTAPNSHYAYSPPLETPQTPHTSISSLDRLRSHNPQQNSPFFENQAYLRYQTSEHSFAQTLDSLQIQQDDGITSSTNLLNGHAFNNLDSRSDISGWRNEEGDAEFDRLYIKDGDNDHQSNHSEDPLDTIGATEAHCTNIVTSRKKPIQQHTVDAGLGISNSTPTLHQPSPKPRSPLPRPGSNATNEELETYISNKTTPTHARRTEPLRRSLVVQQNLCSHTKLQHMLGIDSSPGSSSRTGAHRSRSPRQNTQSPAMTVNEVFSPMKKENERLGFVKKGNLLFREKRTNLTGKVKAGWKVRAEDWLDDDDRH